MAIDLYRLFAQCVSIPYLKTGRSADYAVRRDGGTLYIFFEKSDGAADWRSNLDFPAQPYKRMDGTVWMAHRGFLAVWKEIEGAVAPKIADRSINSIIVCGYSHGAAIAVFCHEYIWYHRPDIRGACEGYGFGCPRVLWGLTGGVRERWATFTVIRNIDDIVTHLPPAFLGYSHVGKMMEIGKKGRYSPIEAHMQQNILNELRLLR